MIRIFSKEKQSVALAAYFNTTENDNDDETPSNDWGDSQDIDEDDKWDDFNTPAQMLEPSKASSTATKTSSGFNASAWTQDKPAAKANDWDTDAFFDDVISSTSKPKLKANRRS